MKLQEISEDKFKHWNLIQLFLCLICMTKKEGGVKPNGLADSWSGRCDIHPALAQQFAASNIALKFQISILKFQIISKSKIQIYKTLRTSY
jgi:hypothetical protein